MPRKLANRSDKNRSDKTVEKKNGKKLKSRELKLASKPKSKKTASSKNISEKSILPKTVEAPKKMRIPIPSGLTGEAQRLALKWRQLYEKNQNLPPATYKMSGRYEAKTPIKHKVLGWGYVLSSQNQRIEVLFQNGVKTLITDFKE